MLFEKGADISSEFFLAHKARLLSKLLEELAGVSSLTDTAQIIVNNVREQIGALSLKLSFEKSEDRLSVASQAQENERPKSPLIDANTPSRGFAIPHGYSPPTPLEGYKIEEQPGPEVMNMVVRGHIVGALEWSSHDAFYSMAARQFLELCAPDLGRLLEQQWRQDHKVKEWHADKKKTAEVLEGGFHDLGNVLTNLAAVFELNEPHLAPRQVERGVELLSLYKLLFRSENVIRQNVDFERIAQELVEVFRVRIRPPRTVDFRIQVLSDDCRTHANRDLIETALENIILNAIDFVPERGSITITIGLQQVDGAHRPVEKMIDGSYACVSVQDNGPGIPPDVQKLLFEWPVTTRGDGHGLGLRNVHRMVTLNRGFVNVETKTGEDSFTRFNLYFPSSAPKQGP